MVVPYGYGIGISLTDSMVEEGLAVPHARCTVTPSSEDEEDTDLEALCPAQCFGEHVLAEHEERPFLLTKTF